MKTKLPKTMYVRIESDKEGVWFYARESLEDLAERGQTTTVGVYQLVETKKITLEVKETPVENENA